MQTLSAARDGWVVGARRLAGRRDLPFPHDVARPCLDQGVYEELELSFPQPSLFHPDAPTVDHRVFRISSQRSLDEHAFAPCWRRFVEAHTSQSFWSRLVEEYGPSIKQLHPGLEAFVGKPLEQWKAVRRGNGERGDVTLECQLVMDTPVRPGPSSEKAPHIDSSKKLWTGLLYMRECGDSAAGGDLELYEAPDDLRFDQHEAPRARVVRHSLYRYAANSFIGFVNSPRAIHSVTPRMPGPGLRRHVDFMAQVETPVFDVPQMGALQRRWFRLLHRETSR